jgi:hypothetical protein
VALGGAPRRNPGAAATSDRGASAAATQRRRPRTVTLHSRAKTLPKGMDLRRAASGGALPRPAGLQPRQASLETRPGRARAVEASPPACHELLEGPSPPACWPAGDRGRGSPRSRVRWQAAKSPAALGIAGSRDAGGVSGLTWGGKGLWPAREPPKSPQLHDPSPWASPPARIASLAIIDAQKWSGTRSGWPSLPVVVGSWRGTKVACSHAATPWKKHRCQQNGGRRREASPFRRPPPASASPCTRAPAADERAAAHAQRLQAGRRPCCANNLHARAVASLL